VSRGDLCAYNYGTNTWVAATAKGARTGALTITDNAPDSPQTVTLGGCGTVVKLLPARLDFGNQMVGTKSPVKTVVLTNTGSTILHFSGISITGANAADFAQSNTCGSSLGAGKSCSLGVTFAPKAKGARSAAVAISDDGGCSPQRVPLSGTGT